MVFTPYLNAQSETDAGDCRRCSVRTVAEVGAFIERFLDELRAACFSEQEIFGLRLAALEALVNGIKHGNAGDPGKQVRILYSVTPGEVQLLIEDEGPGFNPNDVPDPLADENLERPSGRGVYLMRCYMTSVQFNERGNAVMMRKTKARQ